MATDPNLLCSYPRARDYLNQLMKYFINIQPSNPHLEPSRGAWGALSDVLDAAEEWERLNTGVDSETQMEIAHRNYWIKQAEKGIFTEEQLDEAIEKSMREALQKEQEMKQQLESLLPENTDEEGPNG